MRKRLLTVLCIAIGLMMAACGKEMEKTEEEEKATVMGRYIEENVDFPEEISKVHFIGQNEEGKIQFLMGNSEDGLLLYESADKGVNWQKNENISERLFEDNMGIASACIDPDGNIYVSVGKISEDPIMAGREVGEYKYYQITQNDAQVQIEQIHLELPEADEESITEGYGLRNITVSEEGYLFGILGRGAEEYSSYELLCIDLESGRMNWSYDVNGASFALGKDSVFMMEVPIKENASSTYMIYMIGKKDGKMQDRFEVSGEIQDLQKADLDLENESIYYCSSSGIYSTDFREVLAEQLIDGTVCGISDVNKYCEKLLKTGDESFLALFESLSFDGTGWQLVKYEYDSEIPAYPEEQLTVYSLQENLTVRKMIELYKSANPEVYVKYEIGMSDDSSETMEDTIKRLNTEIMAGTGPDVIILNGLPSDSYMEKGVLVDMSEQLDASFDENQLFDNLFAAYNWDGAQYAVPIGVRMSLIGGEKGVIDGIKNLEDVVEKVQNINDKIPMMTTGKRLLRYLLSSSWNEIIDENGNISESKLKSVLENGKKLNEMIYEKAEAIHGNDVYTEHEIVEEWEYEESNSEDQFFNCFYLGGFDIGNDSISMEMGYLASLEEYILGWNVGDVKMFPDNSGVFSSLTASVNAKSEQTQTAAQFIQFMLEDQTQELFYNEWYLPVNRNAFETVLKKPSDEELTEIGRKYGVFEFEWPATSDLKQLEEMIESMDTVALDDYTIMNRVLEQAEKYWVRGGDVDSALNELMKTLKLYLSEQD